MHIALGPAHSEISRLGLDDVAKSFKYNSHELRGAENFARTEEEIP